MKIEVAESLLASWCRHIKQCQIVQTNWKASPTWEFNHRETLETLMQVTNEWFTREFGYNIYKARGLSQLIKQAEIDVLGLRLDSDGIEIYAIDVAFHEGGLLYGNPQETIERVVKKCLRAVMCIRGYFGLTTGEIIFASPKIAESVLPTMRAHIEDMKAKLHQIGLRYEMRIIANEDFSEQILQPVVSLLPQIADTGELFVRSLQMYNMFAKEQVNSHRKKAYPVGRKVPELEIIEGDVLGGLNEMKVSHIVRNILRRMLEEGKAMPEEVELMQTKEYSKQIFDLQFPLLQTEQNEFDRLRYYVDPLTINGEMFYLCSQWYESDRPYLRKWIAEHQ